MNKTIIGIQYEPRKRSVRRMNRQARVSSGPGEQTLDRRESSLRSAGGWSGKRGRLRRPTQAGRSEFQLCAPTSGRRCLLSTHARRNPWRAEAPPPSGRVLCEAGQARRYTRKNQRRRGGSQGRGAQLAGSFPGLSFPLPATRANRVAF